jgi:hypothetical protein
MSVETVNIQGTMVSLSVPKDSLTEKQIDGLKSSTDLYSDINFRIEKGILFIHTHHGEVDGDMMMAVNGDGVDISQYGWGPDGAEPMEMDEFIGKVLGEIETSKK